MVRAVLDGSKTQTRRICKPAQFYSLSKVVEVPDPLERGQVYNGSHFGDEEGDVQFPSPYGGRGDRLWVREAWARTSVFPGTDLVVYREGDSRTDYGGPWKPGIHMFRRDSRITLELTGVRVERLQDIGEADAMAEGTPCYVCGGPMNGISEDDCHCFHRRAQPSDYRLLWVSINGPGSWDLNPWVWCVSFRRIHAS
jgi:hypothetical protein